MAAAIDHPKILPIHEAGEIHGVLLIAMRYVEGPGAGLAHRFAVCREHGADTILSEDRDFRHFSGIAVLRLDDAVTR